MRVCVPYIYKIKNKKNNILYRVAFHRSHRTGENAVEKRKRNRVAGCAFYSIYQSSSLAGLMCSMMASGFDRADAFLSTCFELISSRVDEKRNPQPATFFENCFFYVGGVGMEKAGSLLWACLFCIQIPTYFSKYIY